MTMCLSFVIVVNILNLYESVIYSCFVLDHIGFCYFISKKKAKEIMLFWFLVFLPGMQLVMRATCLILFLLEKAFTIQYCRIE